MENINKFDLNDSFFERVIPKLPIEKTSSDFTMQLMNQIYASVEPEIEPEKYRRQMLFAYISIGAGLIVIAFILFAIWPFFDINLKITSSQVLNFISASLSLVDRISNLPEYLKESSLQISIFFSIFVLFIVERLLRTKITDPKSFIL